jgi:uncharacterized protein YdhG (YjbR/CyaY superfamily)
MAFKIQARPSPVRRVQQPAELPAAQRIDPAESRQRPGGYQSTKGSLHFPIDQPLPQAFVNRLVKARLRELGR